MRLIPVIAWILPALASAGPQVGVITAIEGEVKLLTHPSRKLEGPPPHALFEGLNYSVRDVAVGDRLEKGNVLRTPPGSKARVIFQNGDQFHIAPGTAFRIDWDQDTDDGAAEMRLRHGKGRFMISKGGPRKKFRIRTKTAVMGVRGTDFVVAVHPQTGATETASLRGEVEVAPTAPQMEAVAIEPGQTASVTPPAANAPPPPVEVRPTSQVELEVIRKSSTVAQAPAEAAPPPAVAEEVQVLEKAAVEATLRDIQAADPELHADVDPGEVKSLDAANALTVEKLLEDAPEGEKVAGLIADTSLDEKVSAVAPAEKEETGPERTGLRIGRFQLEGENVIQGERESTTARLSWAPVLRFGRGFWLTFRAGFALLKHEDGKKFPALDFMLVPALRIWGPLAVEPAVGVQAWAVEAGGVRASVGLGLSWNFRERFLGFIERIGVAGYGIRGTEERSTTVGRAGVTFGW